PNTVLVQFLDVVNGAPGVTSAMSATSLAATTGTVAAATIVRLEAALGPGLSAVATPGSRPLLPPGGTPPASDGVEAGKFTVASNSQSPAPAMTSVSIEASGTGDDSLDFTEVAIYRDSGQTPNGVFDILNDILVATKATAFPTNDGTLVFNIFTAEQGFVLSETRTFFVVVKMAAAAQPTKTYD